MIKDLSWLKISDVFAPNIRQISWNKINIYQYPDIRTWVAATVPVPSTCTCSKISKYPNGKGRVVMLRCDILCCTRNCSQIVLLFNNTIGLFCQPKLSYVLKTTFFYSHYSLSSKKVPGPKWLTLAFVQQHIQLISGEVRYFWSYAGWYL
jgi:hypothetical protein